MAWKSPEDHLQAALMVELVQPVRTALAYAASLALVGQNGLMQNCADPPSSHEPTVSIVAGLVLTGGLSTRMGKDKSMLLAGGISFAERVASVLSAAASPCLEVGPQRSSLPAVQEEPQGQGPLVAIVAGWKALVSLGHTGPVLVVACDLPFLELRLLEILRDWPVAGSVVPIMNGRPQTLCARYCPDDLHLAAGLVGAGARAMYQLVDKAQVTFLDEQTWGTEVSRMALVDIDTPEDLQRSGLGGYMS